MFRKKFFMGDIGENPEEVEYEPMPDSIPIQEPSPAPLPAEKPAEPVPV